MKTVVFILLAVAVVGSTGDEIHGGYECSPHSQPWQVYLRIGRKLCGGSLINERWVVSAAHCRFSQSRLIVRLGKHKSVPEATEQRIRVEKIIPHPKYDDHPHNNDIVLIKLIKPAIFNQYVKPIPLTTSCSSAEEQCLVSGWGKTEFGPASVLQCLNLPVLSKTLCRDAYGTIITENMFCAGFMKGDKGTCQGDDGGPLVCNGELKGVVSWAKGCARPGFPGVYVEVCRYTDWIKKIIAYN